MVEVDPTGKRAGRGAYLCARMSCWTRGINEKTLVRALRIEGLTDANREALLKYADERVPEEGLRFGVRVLGRFLDGW